MSEENVALLREHYRDWASGELAAGGEIYAPDVRFEPIADGHEVLDREGFVRFMHEFLAQWDDFRMEAVDFEDLGDTVLVTERQSGTGKRSGIPMEQTDYAIWRFRDGLVTGVRWEIELEAAREAAGISG